MWFILLFFSIFVPRLIMIGIWLFTNWFSMAYNTMIWPLLGFIFLPYTTLAYMAAMINNDGQIAGAWLILIIVAVFFDLGGQGSYKFR